MSALKMAHSRRLISIERPVIGVLDIATGAESEPAVGSVPDSATPPPAWPGLMGCLVVPGNHVRFSPNDDREPPTDLTIRIY